MDGTCYDAKYAFVVGRLPHNNKQQAVRVATHYAPARCTSDAAAGRYGPAAAHPLRLRRPAHLASNSCGRHEH